MYPAMHASMGSAFIPGQTDLPLRNKPYSGTCILHRADTTYAFGQPLAMYAPTSWCFHLRKALAIIDMTQVHFSSPIHAILFNTIA